MAYYKHKFYKAIKGLETAYQKINNFIPVIPFSIILLIVCA